jgi:hypothetical protein
LKKPLAALLLCAATVAALAVPAGAAPSKSRRITAPCATRPGSTEPGHATATWGKTMTVRNPCSHWLYIYWGQTSSGVAYEVRPGVHARVTPRAPKLKPDAVFVDDAWSRGNTPCEVGDVLLVYSSKDVRPTPPCPAS